jgi:hypothetical protein
VVRLQVRQVGDVGVEVFAAQAAKAQRAAVPAGCHVRGFPAHAVRRGDFADLTPYVLGVQEPLNLAPHTVAVPVELHDRDPIDGLTPPVLADAWLRR